MSVLGVPGNGVIPPTLGPRRGLHRAPRRRPPSGRSVPRQLRRVSRTPATNTRSATPETTASDSRGWHIREPPRALVTPCASERRAPSSGLDPEVAIQFSLRKPVQLPVPRGADLTGPHQLVHEVPTQ